jgi:hypothetical protein
VAKEFYPVMLASIIKKYGGTLVHMDEGTIKYIIRKENLP